MIWEVAIKRSLGKLETPPDLAAVLVGAGALELPIRHAHAAAVADLPWHHRDPFDRLLIVQAILEDAVVVGSDEVFDLYGTRRIW